MIHEFIIKVRHDAGEINIHTHANSANAARVQVYLAERCPASAVISTRCVDKDGFERDADNPDQYRRLHLEPAQVRHEYSRDGQQRGDRVPLPYTVQLPGEKRRRRMYGMQDSDTRYLTIDGLKVRVDVNLAQVPK